MCHLAATPTIRTGRKTPDDVRAENNISVMHGCAQQTRTLEHQTICQRGEYGTADTRNNNILPDQKSTTKPTRHGGRCSCRSRHLANRPASSRPSSERRAESHNFGPLYTAIFVESFASRFLATMQHTKRSPVRLHVNIINSHKFFTRLTALLAFAVGGTMWMLLLRPHV